MHIAGACILDKEYMGLKCPLSCGVCAAPPSSTLANAVATFSMMGVSGSITFSQATGSSPTVVTIKLIGLAGIAGDFHVHVSPIQLSSSTPCGSTETGGHFNPLGVPPGQCSPTAPQLCEVGDLSGKSGSLAGLPSADSMYYDSNLPLSGPNSIVGRSVVIHRATGENWVCADIVDPSVATAAPMAAAVTGAPVVPISVCADQNVQCGAWKAAGVTAWRVMPGCGLSHDCERWWS